VDDSRVVVAAPGVARQRAELAVCLCAAWCDTCTAYRATFEAAAQRFEAVRFVWLDIEDQEALLGPVEVENFPTVLIALGDDVRFFGTVTPQAQTLERLLRAHLHEGARASAVDPAVAALLQRLRAH
jgi:thiol-disulfide isomerase/thioredoxin